MRTSPTMRTFPLFVASVVAFGTLPLLWGCGNVETSSNSGGAAGEGSTNSGGGTGGTAGSGGGTAGGGATTSAGGMGGGGGSGAMGGAGAMGGSGGGVPTTCAALVDAISNQTGGVQTCTTVVRLDYQTLAIKGYRILCAPYGPTDETAARAVAEAATGYGQGSQFLSGPNPEDEYVFWEPAGDFGGAGVVNARNGIAVFGGSIVWDGEGKITYPASFEPPASLGTDCKSSAPLTQARGFDLSNGGPLSSTAVAAALGVVWETALPDGLWKNGYVFDAVVLLYPPSVGALNPAVAEWEVLVNSGWLE